MTKTNDKVWLSYPKPAAQRGGCKVSWNYYRTRQEAEACAAAASYNAALALEEGYDFGYCAPGSIRKVEEGRTMTDGNKVVHIGGLYEVCLP